MSLGTDRYKYGTFSVAGTITLSDGDPVVLHTLNITDTTAGTITVKDGTAAAASTVCVHVGGAAGSFRYDAEFGSGLVIVTNGSTKGNVTYTKI